MPNENTSNPFLSSPAAWRVGPHTWLAFVTAMNFEFGNVVPGEPFQINWRFTRFLDVKSPDWGLKWRDSVKARFFIDGHLVHERDGIPVTDEFNGTGNQSDNFIVHNQNVARNVYRIGHKWLEIEILRSDKPTASPYRWGQYIWVIREPIDASWWQWRVAPFQSVPWKDGYSLVADFLNNSRFASVSTLSVEISEVRSEGNPQINPCDYVPVQVENRYNVAAKGGHVSFSFNFLHDWSWLKSGVYVIYGPLNKTFSYAAWFQCTDEYGNIYKGICSARLSRHVGVSTQKKLAAAAAFTATATALALAVSAAAAAGSIFGLPAAPVLFAAAGVAYGVAAASGAIAKDPPSPDPEFREQVEVKPLLLPKWPEMKENTPKSIDALRGLMENAAHLLSLENARTVVRARLMGATIFGDQEAEERQRERYVEIEKEMVEAASKLKQILPDLEKAIEEDPLFDFEKTAIWADTLAEAGISSPMLRNMTEAGLSQVQINELSALFTHEWLLELAKERGLFLFPFVESLEQFVQEVQCQREAVFAGESYIDVPQQSERFSEVPFTDVDAEALLRPLRYYSPVVCDLGC